MDERDETEPAKPPVQKPADTSPGKDREARLAAALRTNLRRRKAAPKGD
jgi:hypothetical protein